MIVLVPSPFQVDADGKIAYDAIARIGHSSKKTIYTKLGDTKAQILREDDERIQKPDMDSVAETTDRTRQALEKLTNSKVGATLPVQYAVKPAAPEYIRYTPATQGRCHL